jgi:hypothetical protein
MDGPPPTNELIGRLTGRLSPAGRAALGRLEALGAQAAGNTAPGEPPDTGAALELIESLPDGDRETVSRILVLKTRAHLARAEEYRQGAAASERGTAALERAHELERAAGREPDPNMTLAEALAVLERHGVMRWTPAEEPDPEV